MKKEFDYLSIEYGRGETYANANIVVYGHGSYPRHSVLAGRSRRVYLEAFPDGSEAEKLAAAKAWAKENYPGVEVDEEINASSHVPIADVTAGLPGRDGHPEYGPIDGLDY